MDHRTHALTAEALTERLSGAERDRSHGPVKVRDAATLIIYDDEAPQGPSVLMGRRSAKHVFMANRYVFPGGRVDPSDSRVGVEHGFAPKTEEQLCAETGVRYTPTRAKALGVAALREAFEETGVLIGREGGPPPRAAAFAAFAYRGLALDLSALSFVARAITPPGRPRRFDTRFFLVPRRAIVATDDTIVGPDGELEDVAWLPIEKARTLELPTITLTVLDELDARLAEDPQLKPGGPVPFYRWRGSGFERIIL